MTTIHRALAASSAAALCLFASSAHAQLGPPPTLEPATTPPVAVSAPPALPTQSIEPPDSAQQLPAISVEPALVFAAPQVATRIESPRFQDRFARVSIATMASVGATLITTSLTVGGVLLASSCGWSCGVNNSITVGSALSVLTLFAAPATYALSADRFGARGAFWATFAGFSVGALVGGGVIALDLALSPAWPPTAVSVTIATLLPFVGQALAYELSARPAMIEAPRTARRNAASPTVALGANGAISVAGQF